MNTGLKSKATEHGCDANTVIELFAFLYSIVVVVRSLNSVTEGVLNPGCIGMILKISLPLLMNPVCLSHCKQDMEHQSVRSSS